MIVFLQLAIGSAFALQAPTLNEVSVDDGNIATLKWRNNVLQSDGNVISRLTVGAMAGENAWVPVATVGKAIDTFKDKGVKGGPRVCYKVSVLDLAGNPAASDSLCADSKKIFLPVKIDDLGYDAASHATILHFQDLSNTEKGYRIYRGKTGDSLSLIGELRTGDSLITGPLTYTDRENLREYEYYSYRVEIHNDSQSQKSSVSRAFTFNLPALVKSWPHIIKFGTELGGIPVKYWVANPMIRESWALKSGDSILIRETGAPDSSYSLLDVSDPKVPLFKGYHHSKIPLPANGISHGNKFFGIKWIRPWVGALEYLKFVNGDFQLVQEDTLVMTNVYSFSFSKDSVLIMESDCRVDTTLFKPAGSPCQSFYSVTDTSMKLAYRNLWPLGIRGTINNSGRIMLQPYDLSLSGGLLTIDDYRFQGPRRFTLAIDGYFASGLKWPIPVASEPDYLIDPSVGVPINPSKGTVPVTILLDKPKHLAYVFQPEAMSVWNYSETDLSTGIRNGNKDPEVKRKAASQGLPKTFLGYDILGRPIHWGGSHKEMPTREPMLIFPVQ